MIKEIKLDDLNIYILPCLQDNYIFILHHQGFNQTVVVDPAKSEEVESFLKAKHLKLSEIWITHHHHDHIGGVLPLKEQFACEVRGSLQIPGRIPAVSLPVKEGSVWQLGDWKVSVLFLPGHTLDHIGYWVSNKNHSLLFSGDVLFGMGCGRLFEGSFVQMMDSLKKITHLPENTLVFCAHEYTEKNLQFTLNENSNTDTVINLRKDKIKKLRALHHPTVPLLLKEELQTNLFLRALFLPNAPEAFSRLREARNHF